MAALGPPSICDLSLNANTPQGIFDGSFVKTTFEYVIAILTLVRDRKELIKEGSIIELVELCSRTYHVLETADDLGNFSKKIMDIGGIGLEIQEWEKRVSRSKNSPGSAEEIYLKLQAEELIIGLQAKLYEILGVLDEHHRQPVAARLPEEGLEWGNIPEVNIPVVGVNTEPQTFAPITITVMEPDEPNPSGPTQSTLLDKNLDLATEAPPFLPANSGVPLPLSPGDVSEQPPVADSGRRALQRLVNGAVPQDEIASHIKSIVSTMKAADIVEFLQGSDAQAFIDVMDNAIDNLDFEPEIRGKCVRSLYKMCGDHAMLPASLHFELPESAMDDVLYRGGFADVLKRKCDGREVAVKALRPQGLTLTEMRKMFCRELITWKSLRHPNVLPLIGVVMTGGLLAMVSEWMTNGNINQFTETRPNENRFKLLADVAKGLIYMHSQKMVHGDLKGENILINQAGQACLADFGLLTLASDVSSSNTFLEGGTQRWMSPELFSPEDFDLRDARPTISSDRYALGMVIYEVLSGQKPYSAYRGRAISVRILRGERPVRPKGAKGGWFTDEIWSISERCWSHHPSKRPGVEDVLRCLESSKLDK